VLETLMELDGREFEEFVRHVLELIGFTAEATQYVGDKGIDVNGVLDAEGLASITLRVQVKRLGQYRQSRGLGAARCPESGRTRLPHHVVQFHCPSCPRGGCAGKVPIR